MELAAAGLLTLAVVGSSKALRAFRKSARCADQCLCLLELPADVLDNLLTFLDTRDRLRLLSCCRQLQRLAAHSTALCADLDVRLDSLAQLRQFAASWPASASVLRQLRHARISCHGFQGGRRGSRATQALADALARAGSLEALEWTIVGNQAPRLERLAAAGALPLLRSLAITCHAPLALPAALGSALPNLQELRIWEDGPLMVKQEGSNVALGPGCLPPSLHKLELATLHTDLHYAIAAATQLTQLAISTSGDRLMQLAGLERLTGLRRLALRDFWCQQAYVLHKMQELPQLQRLDLSFSEQRAPDGLIGEVWRGLGRLSGLRSLRELCLGQWDLKKLPPKLLASPALKALHLEGNPHLSMPAGGALLGGPCHLTLDAEAALKNLEALQGMAGLQQLGLASAPSGWHGVQAALQDALGALPCFQRVYMTHGPSWGWRAQRASRLAALPPPAKALEPPPLSLKTVFEAAGSFFENSFRAAGTILETNVATGLLTGLSTLQLLWLLWS